MGRWTNRSLFSGGMRERAEHTRELVWVASIISSDPDFQLAHLVASGASSRDTFGLQLTLLLLLLPAHSISLATLYNSTLRVNIKLDVGRKRRSNMDFSGLVKPSTIWAINRSTLAWKDKKEKKMEDGKNTDLHVSWRSSKRVQSSKEMAGKEISNRRKKKMLIIINDVNVLWSMSFSVPIGSVGQASEKLTIGSLCARLLFSLSHSYRNRKEWKRKNNALLFGIFLLHLAFFFYVFGFTFTGKKAPQSRMMRWAGL